jgi:hypothetical protein
MPAVIRRSEMEKLSYLMDQYSKLQANEIDRYQFVKAIGYKYSAKTNKCHAYSAEAEASTTYIHQCIS